MRTVVTRILDLFRRRAAETRLDDEVRAHLELLAADYVRRGMTSADARLAARRAFGGVEPMKERHRDSRTLPGLDDLRRDLRYAVRSLRKSPGFTAACTVILALGIGLNLALFQLVNVTTLQPLAVREPDRLARFFRLDTGGTDSTLPYAGVEFVRRNQGVLSAVLMQAFSDVAWAGDPADRVGAAYVSANWFRELGYDASVGRVFSEQIDDRPDAAAVIVVSHAFWRNRLGGQPGIVGSVVRINEQPATVIGIAPREFPGLRLRDVSVWMPIEQIELFTPGSNFRTTWQNNTEMYGRLQAGVSLAAARDGLRAAMGELAKQHPDAFGASEWLEPYSAAVRFESSRDRRQRLTLALTAGSLTVLVLLIACANVNNLVLSRAGERLREISIRTALGASRWRVVRQLMTESLALAALGSLGGLLAGGLAADAIASGTGLPPFLDFSPDWRTIAAALAVSVLAMIAIGFYPAWKVSHGGVAASLKDGGQQATGGLERARFRQALIGAQLGATCLLLLVAGSMLQSLQRALWSDPGFEFSNVAVLEPSISRYGIDGLSARTYWAGVKASVAALPAVDSAVLVSRAPLGRDAEQSTYPGTGSLQVTITRVEPEFFDLMKIPMVAGRSFVAGDDPRATVIVSRRLALAMYGSLAIVGEAFPKIPLQYADRFAGRPRRTIVGIADDARLIRITATDGAEQYWPIDPADAGSLALIVRARRDAARLLTPLRDIARQGDSRVLAQARLMTDDFETRVSPIRLGSSVTGVLALLALSLACIGVFAVVSYGAMLRTKELGIRITLGAPRGSLMRVLLGRLVWPTALGLVSGAAAAVPLIATMRGAPFFLPPSFDVSVHALVISLLAATVGAAGLFPAARALRRDPVSALRFE